MSLGIVLSLTAWGHGQAADPPPTEPTSEKVWVVTSQVDSTHWLGTVHLTNTEILAAITLPFRWGSREHPTPFIIDSASYAGTRVEYFSLKTFLVDTTEQTVLIALVSDLGANLPPLEPDSGAIAKLHFTALTPSPGELRLDTTMVPPRNTLQLVTPDVRAITPAFEALRAK